MKIKIYSKDGCDKCESAKKNIKLMGFEYEERSASHYSEWHKGWQNDGSVNFKAEYVKIDGQLPVIEINKLCYSYAEAMLFLKRIKKNLTNKQS